MSEPIAKIDEYEMKTASGEVWKVVLLGDKATNGKRYCEGCFGEYGCAGRI